MEDSFVCKPTENFEIGYIKLEWYIPKDIGHFYEPC